MFEKFLAIIEKLLTLVAGFLAYRAGKTAMREEQLQVMHENDKKAAAARRRVDAMADADVLQRLHECWRRD